MNDSKPEIMNDGRSGCGRGPLPEEMLRTHTISTRLNKGELEWLDSVRAGSHMKRGEYLRVAAMGTLPPTIPAINRTAWSKLSSLSSNLNQITKRINSGQCQKVTDGLLESIKAELVIVRQELIGVDTSIKEQGDDS